MNDNHKKKWRKKCREYLAAAFGGKCAICGYNKSIVALDYHHVDPETKNDQLSTAMRNGYAWHKIVQEARKCACLCCRCHRELHAKLVELPIDFIRFNEEYCDIVKLRKKEFNKCPICGEEKLKNYQYCSIQCRGISQRHFEIEKENLEELLKEKSYEEIGKIYGISGKAIKTRCKKLGIITDIKRGYWMFHRKKKLNITKKQLESLLQKNSINKIAKMLKVTHKTLKDRINSMGVVVPNINWHKIH